MNTRHHYKVTYRPETNRIDQDILDNDTEFNANQFKLYDDFSTDLRVGYNSMRNSLYSFGFSGTNSIGSERFDDGKGADAVNGNPVVANNSDLLENEVMVDTWSSMDSSNSPLTDSVASVSEECTPSTSKEPPCGSSEVTAASPHSHSIPGQTVDLDRNSMQDKIGAGTSDKPRSRDLRLDLDILEPHPRRPHFLDDDFQSPSKSNIECRIPKPHFLDHIPSPDELDEKNDITNPNFLDEDVSECNDNHTKSGALPKKPQKPIVQEEKPRTHYRSALHYGLDRGAHSSERDKRTSQLYRDTWPGEKDVWSGQDTASVRSFSSNGSAEGCKPSSLENKMECVYSLLSLLTLSPDSNADLSGPLLDMSRSVESCIAMRQAGCIPLLVQLIHSKLARETRDRAAKALRNIIHTQTDDKAGRREARVWRLLEQVREYCYILEDMVEARKEGKDITEDEEVKHPSQSVAALMKLSFDEEHRHVVCQLGGLQALAALVSGDQVAHGSRTDDNTCLTMRKYAGMTLTNLTFGDGNNKSLLCSFKDFMMALVEQLESPNDDMRQVTAAVLRNLSWRADTNSKQVLREVGAVTGLTKAAMTCQKEATLKSVLSALWNLTAHCSMNKVALCSVDGALGFLVDMLSYNSPSKTLAIVENAGGIMRNVSSHIAVREDYRQILRERNCLSVLLQHLKSPSLTVVSNSCGTLWNLSARCPQDQQFLWDHGAVPMLRSLIHSKHKMIAMGSSAALKNLLNSKPGKLHIISLDTTAKNMNLPALPTLGVRKQKALEQELDQNLAETCDNIEPATSPTTTNRDEKNLFTATERQIAMNLERHRMTSSSPLVGTLSSQISLSHSAHLAGYLSCSNTLLKGALTSRSAAGSANNVNRSDSKDSVTSAQSDTVFERVMRTGKVPVPTPRSKDLVKTEFGSEGFKESSTQKDCFVKYPTQPPVPPPRSTPDMRTNFTESGYDVDQDSCDQPIDFSQKYSETKSGEPTADLKSKTKKKKESYGDYQETDLDQPTDYSLRYAEHHSETGSDGSDPPGPSADEDTIKHFATEGTPYETPVVFSNATSMSDLRVISGKDKKPKLESSKENPEIMTHSDEKDTCSIEEPPRHDNDRAVIVRQDPIEEEESEKRGHFDTKFSSGMISPEKPVNYCDEGTPGCFSRVSSLSSLGEPTEEDCLAKKNAMATIHVDPGFEDHSLSSSVKDKEGSKAVTFATDIELSSQVATPGITSERNSPPPVFVEDTPLMFSRSSSLGSLPDCADQPGEHVDVVSEVSVVTSCCDSPTSLPDSPGAVSPPQRSEEQSDEESEHTAEHTSVFAERATTFVVENTPAHFSTATSLSSLAVDDDVKTSSHLIEEKSDQDLHSSETQPLDLSTNPNRSPLSHSAEIKEPCTPGQDSCKIYYTEDTPAILSKAGSNSNLSVLSINSTVAPPNEVREAPEPALVDTSDSSNLSDSTDLLEECILKGIAQVVKNKGPASESGSGGQVTSRDGPYRSLPPYLRTSTETIKMSHDYSRNIRESPPPLPPKSASATAPPRPPRDDLALQNRQKPAPTSIVRVASLSSLDSFGSTDREIFEEAVKAGLASLNCRKQDDGRKGRKHESRLPVKTKREKPKLPVTTNLSKNDSLSSLSMDSFGSTDREIFEEAVKAGISSLHSRAQTKAHSVERPAEFKHSRQHKSLDRSDRITQYRPKAKDPEFQRNIAAGAYNLKTNPKVKKIEQDFRSLSLTRSPYSYHGDASSSLAHHSRRGYSSKHFEEGPPSLPIRIDHPKNFERSNSLSSLSNDSFGSTDREVFERCVRVGMKVQTPRNDSKVRGRSDDRLEKETYRSRRRTDGRTKDKCDSHLCRERGVIEERDRPSKNVQAPSVVGATADGDANTALNYMKNGSEIKNSPDNILLDSNGYEIKDPSDNIPTIPHDDSAFDTSGETHEVDAPIKNLTSQIPTFDSGNTTLESVEDEMENSNECLAVKSANTTLESEIKDELNRSNESYADMLNASFSEAELPKHYDSGTLTRKKRPEWTEIKMTGKPANFDDLSIHSNDTWNDNTCPDDVTFPTISGSVHMISSIKSEVTDMSNALPDLLEKSELGSSSSRPDLTNKLDRTSPDMKCNSSIMHKKELLESVQQPSFTSLLDDGEPKFDSILTAAIEKEAAMLAVQLKNSNYQMETSVTSLNSLDLENVRPPSNFGSLLSLTASGHFEDTFNSKKSQKSRKKSLPVSSMVKKALSNSMHHGSNEHLDSNPVSLLENIKPPSEFEHIDMESSMISVSSIVSEVAELREKTPVVFDFKQPIQEFPMCSNFTVYQDLDKVNPPSLFDEIPESTVEFEQTTAQQVYEDCISNTLNVITDIPSGSENCTPLPSDVSSVESTPKKTRDLKYLTPKEKRQAAKDRYQTYTITDVFADEVTSARECDEFLTWTKSEDSKSDEYVTANSETKSKKRLSAKQRRIEDRARYQTQTVDIATILTREENKQKSDDPDIENLKQRLAAKKTLKQKRIEDAERFRTRTLSDDIPPSPTFIIRDINYENIETTTGYDSLSSNELNHQQIIDDRHIDDVFGRDADSGHNEDDSELHSAQMLTFTKSFRNNLPAIESPTTIDMIVVNNLKNIEMTASYRRALHCDVKNNPSSSDFASYEGDTNSEGKAHTDSETDTPPPKIKPKIIKPGFSRDQSLDSNDSHEQDDAPKAIRGRKKPSYVSPYRRNTTTPKRPATVPTATKPSPKPSTSKTPARPTNSAKTPVKTSTPKALSANTSPKKTPLKSGKTVKPVALPLSAMKILPLERQGTFTKEESTVPPQDLPIPDKKIATKLTKAVTPTRPVSAINTSPSRLPQFNRRPPPKKTNSIDSKTRTPSTSGAIRSSASNHSLQSTDSGKTVTLTKNSRQGSASSVNSASSSKTKDIESKIAGLWKKVEQTKKQVSKPDRRVWISGEPEPPKLIRSSTFEGQPKQTTAAPKQKTAIGIRVSQIPGLKPKTQPKLNQAAGSSKMSTPKVFGRKQLNGQL